MQLKIKRHINAFFYVITTILPLLFRFRQRPVIFSKWSGIGDIICTFPAALELKKSHPGAICIYNCHPDFACLPRLAGVTERTTSFEHIGLVGFWYWFLLGGFYQFASDDDNPKIVPKDVYIKDFGRNFGVEVEAEHPRLPSDPEVVMGLKERLSALGVDDDYLVVIHPGPSWPVREWPEPTWIALVEQLHTGGFKNVIQIGTSNHALTPSATELMNIKGVISLVDELTLEESIAIISLANVFIGIDSGMLHIAASVGTPGVGLWGPSSPQFRFSEKNRQFHITSKVSCQGCQHRVPREHWITGCPHDIECMNKISVEQVLFKANEAILKDKSQSN